MRPDIIFVDNYDSFTQNVVHLIVGAGARCRVVPHDEMTATELVELHAHGYVIGAGPCTPARAGASSELPALLAARLPDVPLLGLCLGHQAIALAHGGSLRRASEPMHGKLATITHDGSPLLDVVPSPFEAARYNSLVVDEATFPSSLIATAHDEHGDVMALRHPTLPHSGWQFHPESWLCPDAAPLLDAWVESTWVAGLARVGQALF
jgi:anthranilate synthase/aminodeoxychorismate synthase-like glutamine amidotransferase